MFGLFNKHRIAGEQFLKGATDIHCHILPGVDDGFVSLSTSCELLEREAAVGVKRIYLTPHSMGVSSAVVDPNSYRSHSHGEHHHHSSSGDPTPPSYTSGRNYNAEIEKLKAEGPDYYPESSIESDYYAYVRPSVMAAFMKLLSDIDVSGWENRSWGHAVHDLFYVLKEQPKDDLGCHKYYVSPGKDLYKKLIKGIQQVCFESLKGHQNRRFVNVFNASTMPYYRAALPFRQSMQIFHDIDLEQKEMKEGHFDLAEDLKDD